MLKVDMATTINYRERARGTEKDTHEGSTKMMREIHSWCEEERRTETYIS